jgi:hypothetical protein
VEVVESVIRWGVADQGGFYFLQTANGSVVRFSNDGVDGSDFTGWPDYSFEDYCLSVSYDCGSVNLEGGVANSERGYTPSTFVYRNREAWESNSLLGLTTAC